ncbi:hypothetical protein PC128_g17268 [Phytophthora cactorum]|nr:hypothetical protein PC128_g17268 [Phytophthora cactorum]
MRAAPPLFSRYEEDRRDPSVVTNDLDEAQSRQLFTDSSSQRSYRPVARPLTVPSRCGYGFQPLDPVETVRRYRCRFWTLMCVCQRPRRHISKCNGTRSASACNSSSTDNRFPPCGPYLRSSGLGGTIFMKHDFRIGWRELDGSFPTMLFELVSLKLTFD